MGSKKPLDPEKLATIEKGDIARSVVATGKIQPPPRSQIKSKASGIVKQLLRRLRRPREEGPGPGGARQGRAAGAACARPRPRVLSTKAALERTRVEAEGPDLPFLKSAHGARAEAVRATASSPTRCARTRRRPTRWPSTSSRRRSSNVAVNQAEVARAQAALERAADRPAQLHHREPDGRPRAVARRRGGRRRQLHPGDGLAGDADHDAGRRAAASTCWARWTRPTSARSTWTSRRASWSSRSRTRSSTARSPRSRRSASRRTTSPPSRCGSRSTTPAASCKANMSANAEIIREEKKGVLLVPESALIYDKDKKTFRRGARPQGRGRQAQGRREGRHHERRQGRDRSRA